MADPGSAIRSHRVELAGVRLHYLEAGSADAPCLVLLHGWPQTGHEWHAVIPALAEHYRVIAPDLRGLGASSRPDGEYDQRTAAGDVVGLMDMLGLRTVKLVGHDLGAITAYAMAAQWRDRVEKLAILEVVLPALGLERMVGLGPGGWGIWHFPFHAAVDVAELLTRGKEREYLSYFFRNYSYDPRAISAEQIDNYVRAYTQPGAMRAGFRYYRAFYENTRQNRETLAMKLKIPVLAIGGSASVGSLIADDMRAAAETVEALVAPQCGHWVPEEQPAWLAERLIRFFS